MQSTSEEGASSEKALVLGQGGQSPKESPHQALQCGCRQPFIRCGGKEKADGELWPRSLVGSTVKG